MSDHPGIGLGLSIIAAIAQHYGLRFWLENRRDASGLVARLVFPDLEVVRGPAQDRLLQD